MNEANDYFNFEIAVLSEVFIAKNKRKKNKRGKKEKKIKDEKYSYT